MRASPTFAWSVAGSQVQPVQLMERHQVDQALDVVDAEEMARDVEHHAAPAEAGRVVDLDGGHAQHATAGRFVLDRRGQQLPQRLHAVEESRGMFRGDDDARLSGRETIALSSRAGAGAQIENDRPVARHAGRVELDILRRRGCRRDHPRERAPRRGRGLGRDHDAGVARDVERFARPKIESGGCGNQGMWSHSRNRRRNRGARFGAGRRADEESRAERQTGNAPHVRNANIRACHDSP